MDIIVVTAVLAFLIGMAVGIAGYFFCTILRYEKEIEAIFDRVVERYENIISHKDKQNKRIYEAYRRLQERQMESEVKDYEV